jgi:GNAT superfamily N-acetyltransferase
MNKSNVQPLPHVRPAVMGDYNDLIAIGREALGENRIQGITPDEDLMIQMAFEAIEGKSAVVGCIGPVGNIEGAIHLAVRQFCYTRNVHLEELWAYVRPQYRKSRNAQALLQFAKDLAKELKLPLLIGILSSERTETKVKMYRRKLGAPSGAYFLYNTDTGVG